MLNVLGSAAEAVLLLAFSLFFIVLLSVAIRRLLGVSISPVRLVLAAILALVLGNPLVRNIAVDAGPTDEPTAPLWLVLLGIIIMILVAMTVLVLAEVLLPTGSIPGPRTLVHNVRGWLRRSHRYLQILRIGARHGLAARLREARNSPSLQANRALGSALRDVLTESGTTFVKLGQLIATRPELVPTEVADELASLHDDVAPVGWEAISDVLDTELRQPTDQVFATIDAVPMAAASIGQVHAATLHDGREVVVKVRRPGIEVTVRRDLDIAVRIAERLDRRGRGDRAARLLADGLATALTEELDFSVEAANLRTSATASAARADHGVERPAVVEELSSAAVLVMERTPGLPLRATAIPLGQERATAGRALVAELMDQVLHDGIFHADPHPGNVLVRSDGRLGLLDWGSVGRLDGVQRAGLQRLLVAADRSDPAMLTDVLLELSERPDDLDLVALERDLGDFLARYLGPGARPDAAALAKLFTVVRTHGVLVHPQIAAVLRAIGTLDGTLRLLHPALDVMTEARTLVASRPQSAWLADVTGLSRVPQKMSRILDDVEHGRAQVRIRLLADPEDRRLVRDLMHEALIVVLAATTGIMGVLLLGTEGGPAVSDTISLYALLGYYMLTVSAVLGLRALVRIFRGAH
ncbi:MAG TPA: AarF/UbiB family protein [Jiangellaceae bacterium]|nr:AarF/UbiB family protein [Jiangellaceae bacterium]